MSLARELARRMLGTEKAPARARLPPRLLENAERARTAMRPAPPEVQVDDPPASPPLTLPPQVPEAAPAPLPVPKAGWRGNCRAVSASTGRRCALLDGHQGCHRHGSTEFASVALTDDDIARARARLDAAATSRRSDSSPHEMP